MMPTKWHKGLIDNEFELMNARSVNNIINKGGTIIRSSHGTLQHLLRFESTTIEKSLEHDQGHLPKLTIF